MTDKQWQSVINKCRSAGDEHLRLLKIAEDEYVRRYGQHPSEVDDDWWIDALHQCKGNTDLQKIKESAEQRFN
jgi:hypothetical protein